MLARLTKTQRADAFLPHRLEEGKAYVILERANNGNDQYIKIKIKAVAEGFKDEAVFNVSRFNLMGK